MTLLNWTICPFAFVDVTLIWANKVFIEFFLSVPNTISNYSIVIRLFSLLPYRSGKRNVMKNFNFDYICIYLSFRSSRWTFEKKKIVYPTGLFSELETLSFPIGTESARCVQKQNNKC